MNNDFSLPTTVFFPNYMWYSTEVEIQQYWASGQPTYMYSKSTSDANTVIDAGNKIIKCAYVSYYYGCNNGKYR